ncbi:hypothetical protein BDY21DRAFT_76326 [Lineolata rhizophorae]|uniref:Uncharacterized protein n=1 Tax=Lineolata rhizophorae TaxID=578093 RepID=A0A6A6NTA7_9PEZI|nr:hypothetical protein BDY21DRAFT_76326 [Lineolata rhizophorae]
MPIRAPRRCHRFAREAPSDCARLVPSRGCPPAAHRSVKTARNRDHRYPCRVPAAAGVSRPRRVPTVYTSRRAGHQICNWQLLLSGLPTNELTSFLVLPLRSPSGSWLVGWLAEKAASRTVCTSDDGLFPDNCTLQVSTNNPKRMTMPSRGISLIGLAAHPPFLGSRSTRYLRVSWVVR